RADGSLAPSLGGGGSAVTDFGQPAAITQILIGAHGRITASGKATASLFSLNPSRLSLALARYNHDGSLDPTFGGTGTTIIGLDSAGTTPPPRSVGASSGSLQQKFDALKQSAQGALATNQGGGLLDIG